MLGLQRHGGSCRGQSERAVDDCPVRGGANGSRCELRRVQWSAAAFEAEHRMNRWHLMGDVAHVGRAAQLRGELDVAPAPCHRPAVELGQLSILSQIGEIIADRADFDFGARRVRSRL